MPQLMPAAINVVMPQLMPAPINVVNGKALGNEICMRQRQGSWQ